MIDTGWLHSLPGRSFSSQFIGWAFVDPRGKSATGVTRDLMVQLCAFTLHLDGFEQALAGELQ